MHVKGVFKFYEINVLQIYNKHISSLKVYKREEKLKADKPLVYVQNQLP